MTAKEFEATTALLNRRKVARLEELKDALHRIKEREDQGLTCTQAVLRGYAQRHLTLTLELEECGSGNGGRKMPSLLLRCVGTTLMQAKHYWVAPHITIEYLDSQCHVKDEEADFSVECIDVQWEWK